MLKGFREKCHFTLTARLCHQKSSQQNNQQNGSSFYHKTSFVKAATRIATLQVFTILRNKHSSHKTHSTFNKTPTNLWKWSPFFDVFKYSYTSLKRCNYEALDTFIRSKTKKARYPASCKKPTPLHFAVHPRKHVGWTWPCWGSHQLWKKKTHQ